ncbi:MAG: histidine--tRNA ligase [Holophagaceae bacterium]
MLTLSVTRCGRLSTMTQSVKGMRDLWGTELAYFQFIERACHQIMGSHGYQEIRTPIVESTDLFSRGVGSTTDIVNKEMYTFRDRSDRSLTLRPENTASVVRAIIQNKLLESNDPLHLFYIGPMFRYERMQAGRYRQFWQIGAESIGIASPESEVESIIMLFDFLTSLGLGDLSLSINSVGFPEERASFYVALKAFVKDREQAFCEDCRRRIEDNPLRVLDCKVSSCQTALTGHPEILNFLSNESQSHHEKFQKRLQSSGIPFLSNPKMVRGLDYYTRTTFEVLSSDLGAQSALLGGGRYDRLIQDLGGPPTPAFGWAIGLDRLVSLVMKKNISLPSKPRILLIPVGETMINDAFELARSLWADGHSVELETRGVPLKKSLSSANRKGHSHAFILGESEKAKGIITVKFLMTGKQEEWLLSEISSRILHI